MQFRTVYDFTTGESTQVELTPEEIAADEANAAAQGPLVRIATARQFKAACVLAGLITEAEMVSPDLPAIAAAALAGTPDATRIVAKSTWANMTTVPENDPLLLAIQAAASLTVEDRTALFNTALAIT